MATDDLYGHFIGGVSNAAVGRFWPEDGIQLQIVTDLPIFANKIRLQPDIRYKLEETLMAISSVNSTSNAAELAKQANNAQQVDAAAQAEQARKQQAAQAQNKQQAQQHQQSKPVVNTSGHVTGQVVNTTA